MTFVLMLFAVLRLLLALVFAFSAFTKLADQDGFRGHSRASACPSVCGPTTAVLISVLELGIGLGLLPTVSAWPAALGAAGLLLVFSVAITASLALGKRPDCHCFWQF